MYLQSIALMVQGMLEGIKKNEKHINKTHENEGEGGTFIRAESKTNTSDSQVIIVMD